MDRRVGPESQADMNAVDRWYNHHFPAHSVARLLFLLAAAVPIGLLTGLMFRGLVLEEMLGPALSWAAVIFLVLVSQATVAIGWHTARSAPGAKIGTPVTRPLPTGPEPSPPPWALPEMGLSSLSRPVSIPLREAALIVLGVLVYLLVTMALMGVADIFNAMSLGLAFVIAIVLTAAWYLRATVAAPILLSLLLGAGATPIVLLFTFWLGGSLLSSFVFCLVVAATFVFPAWSAFRRQSLRVPRPPTWAVLVMTCVMVWGTALLVRLSDSPG